MWKGHIIFSTQRYYPRIPERFCDCCHRFHLRPQAKENFILCYNRSQVNNLRVIQSIDKCMWLTLFLKLEIAIFHHSFCPLITLRSTVVGFSPCSGIFAGWVVDAENTEYVNYRSNRVVKVKLRHQSSNVLHHCSATVCPLNIDEANREFNTLSVVPTCQSSITNSVFAVTLQTW